MTVCMYRDIHTTTLYYLYNSIREVSGSNINWAKMPQAAGRIVYFCPNLFVALSHAIMSEDFHGSLQSLPAISGLVSSILGQDAFLQIILFIVHPHCYSTLVWREIKHRKISYREVN